MYSKAFRPSVRGRREVRAARANCEDIALRLLEPRLSHATREHLAARLQQQADDFVCGGESTPLERTPNPRVVAELMHSLEIVGAPRRDGSARTVSVVGSYPLPWGFRDDEGWIEAIIRTFFDDALRWAPTGFVTVSFGYDTQRGALNISIVDTREARRGRWRCAAFAARQRQSDQGSRRGSPMSLLSAMIKRIEKLGGRFDFALSSHGYSLTDLVLPITPVGSLLHGEDDVGRSARVAKPLPSFPGVGYALIVDRAVSTLRSLGITLRNHGIDSVSVPHGALAVETLKTVRCDSLWIDVEDPLVSTGEIRLALRRVGFIGMLVGLSAHPINGQGPGVESARFDAIVEKPISNARIYRCISRLGLREGPDRSSIMLGRSKEREDAAAAELRGVIAEYVAHLPTLLRDLDRSLGRRDLPVAQRIAHTLKAGTVFGFPDVTAVARQLESALKSGDRKAVQAARDTLAGVVARLIGLPHGGPSAQANS